MTMTEWPSSTSRLEAAEERRDVVHVEADGRLVEEIEDVPVALVDEVKGQLDPLQLAAREGRRRLAQAQVAQADVLEGLDLLDDVRPVGEELEGVVDGQVQDVVDVLPLVADLEDLALEPLPLAGLAGQGDVGQELHLHDLLAGALAVLAAAAGRVEREIAGLVAQGLGLARLAEEVADAVHGLGVGGGDGARRGADRRLVDHDDLVDELQAADVLETLPRALAAPALVEDVVEEGALARARDARDAGEDAQRQADVEMPEVVLVGVPDEEEAAGFAAPLGDGDLLLAADVAGRQGVGLSQECSASGRRTGSRPPCSPARGPRSMR